MLVFSNIWRQFLVSPPVNNDTYVVSKQVSEIPAAKFQLHSMQTENIL